MTGERKVRVRWGWRRIHKWIAIGAGVFLLVWLITGIWIILPPPNRPALHTANPVTEYATATLSPAEAAEIARGVAANASTRAIGLARLGSRPIYRVPAPGRGGPILIDAADGTVVTIDEAEARRIATEFYGGDGALAGPGERVEARGASTLYAPIPAYRFVFDDAYRTQAYVGIADGSVYWVDRRIAVRRWAGSIHGFGPIADFVSNKLRLLLVGVGFLIAMGATLTGYWLALRRKRRA